MDGSLEPSLAAACCLGACEREQSEERKQGGKRRGKLREMEINKGEANKERGTASKKEICYAHKHKHGCGVWRERESARGPVLCTASPYCYQLG